jgi:hypothetical protein
VHPIRRGLISEVRAEFVGAESRFLVCNLLPPINVSFDARHFSAVTVSFERTDDHRQTGATELLDQYLRFGGVTVRGFGGSRCYRFATIARKQRSGDALADTVERGDLI